MSTSKILEQRIRNNFLADMQRRYKGVNEIKRRISETVGGPIEAEMKYANPLGIKLEAA